MLRFWTRATSSSDDAGRVVDIARTKPEQVLACEDPDPEPPAALEGRQAAPSDCRWLAVAAGPGRRLAWFDPDESLARAMGSSPRPRPWQGCVRSCPAMPAVAERDVRCRLLACPLTVTACARDRLRFERPEALRGQMVAVRPAGRRRCRGLEPVLARFDADVECAGDAPAPPVREARVARQPRSPSRCLWRCRTFSRNGRVCLPVSPTCGEAPVPR